MRALSLIQPWCWAIAHDTKRLENRTDGGFRELSKGFTEFHRLERGEFFGLHASKTKPRSEDIDRVMKSTGRSVLPNEATHTRGALIGAAVVVDILRRADPAVITKSGGRWAEYKMNPTDRDRFVYDLQMRDIRCETERRQDQLDRWFMGPFALVLDHVVQFAVPVPCSGSYGFWTVPDEEAAQCGERMRFGWKDRGDRDWEDRSTENAFKVRGLP